MISHSILRESKEEIRYLNPALLEDSLWNTERPLILKNQFRDYLVGGRLFIKKFDFCKHNDVFEDIDFSDCVLSDCDFSYLVIEDCRLEHAELIRCQMKGIAIVDGTTLPASMEYKKNDQCEQHANKIRSSYLLLKDPNIISYQWLETQDFNKNTDEANFIHMQNGFYYFSNFFKSKKNFIGMEATHFFSSR